MKLFGGNILFLDRDNINTDEIIPAKYLTEIDKKALQPHLLEDLVLDDFDPHGKTLDQAKVLITKSNFGCGSSREHAVWALEVNDITAVVTQSCARIFRQNMFNCGLLAIELAAPIIDSLFSFKQEKDLHCHFDFASKELILQKNATPLFRAAFHLESFNETLLKSGGWVEYAYQNY